LAALLSFIPILGPILALIPAVLVGLTISPRIALYVFLLYTAIQFVESYILTPIIQERTVSMSPVVTIMTQVVAGLLLGPLAIALAHPAAAVFTVLINVLYVEDTLGDHEVEVDPTPA
jgi:predicted PurR-regulated permease PerM